MLKWQLNYTKKPANKEILTHSMHWVSAIIMALAQKRMYRRLLTYIVKQLTEDMLGHNLILMHATIIVIELQLKKMTKKHQKAVNNGYTIIHLTIMEKTSTLSDFI